ALALALLGVYSFRRIVAERDVAESRRQEAELRVGELFAEQGRQALAAGDPARALAWLAEAMRRRAADAGTRLLAGQALVGIAPLEPVRGGNTQAVMHVASSPDGKRLLSAGMDSRVALWDLATRRVVVAVPGGYIAGFTPDGKSVVTANIYGPIM